MTRCELATGMLTGYVAGELGPMEQAIVAEHLAECAGCQAELAREQKLRALMGDVPAYECPDELTAAITAAVDAEPAPRHHQRTRRFHSWSGTLAAASLVAAAVLLAVVLPRSEPLLDATAVSDPQPESTSWTQDELDRAREDAQWALAFTASIIDKAEKQTMADVMRRLQEETFSGFRGRSTPTSPGGQG